MTARAEPWGRERGLLVVTASGLAREVLAMVVGTGTYDDVRVVDDDSRTWGAEASGCAVVGGLERVRDFPEHHVVVCAGQGAVRRDLVARLASLGVTDDRYVHVVAPSVHLPIGCSIGAGTIVLAGVVITTDVQLGRHVVVMPHVTLTHDDRVDDYATLCAGVQLGGAVSVGSGAYLGMASSVRERVRVGRDAVLGMGAALVCDLPDGQTWVGVPARPLGQVGMSGHREVGAEL